MRLRVRGSRWLQAVRRNADKKRMFADGAGTCRLAWFVRAERRFFDCETHESPCVSSLRMTISMGDAVTQEMPTL